MGLPGRRAARRQEIHRRHRSYQKALAIKPNTGTYLSGLADAYAKSGQTDKAVQEYAAAAQADPTNAGTYYYNEGAVFTNTGKIDEAVAAFDKAIELDPKRADAYYWKGVDLIGKATMKDNKMVAPAGTAEAFNKYLELQPSGKYADAAKQMLASIGSSVDTSYVFKPQPATTRRSRVDRGEAGAPGSPRVLLLHPFAAPGSPRVTWTFGLE